MIKIKSQISKSDILNNLTEEEIFRYYIPEFKELNKKFCSPFTNEKTPSCSIFYSSGRLFYKDFSSGNGGDVFNFVKTKYNLTDHETLVVISNDLNLKIGEYYLKQKISPNLIIKSFNKDDASLKLKSRIRIKSKNFTDRGLAYWKQYGIDKKTLEFFNIQELAYYWINNTRFKTDLGFAYNFNWYSPYTYKILQPEEAKEFKWFSNCPDTLLQNYNKLPEKGDKLFITSSYKDAITLYLNGFNAIAPSSENTIPSELVIDELKSRFDVVVSYMNNDTAGIKASLKYENLGLKWIVNPEGMPKDPSDLHKEGYNVKEIVEYLCFKHL